MVATVLVAIAVVAAAVIGRRRPDPPAQPRWAVPAQLDRADFARPDAPWLVAVFTSATCRSCSDAVRAAAPLASAQVGVDEVEVGARPHVHRRYGVEAVPTVVVADSEGAVRASFVGCPPAAELWTAVAGLREPGSS